MLDLRYQQHLAGRQLTVSFQLADACIECSHILAALDLGHHQRGDAGDDGSLQIVVNQRRLAVDAHTTAALDRATRPLARANEPRAADFLASGTLSSRSRM